MEPRSILASLDLNWRAKIASIATHAAAQGVLSLVGLGLMLRDQA